MTINEFAIKVSEKEGLKKQINIAQIKEVLRVCNDLMDKEFYKLIKKK